jgi:hypothetical protein
LEEANLAPKFHGLLFKIHDSSLGRSKGFAQGLKSLNARSESGETKFFSKGTQF